MRMETVQFVGTVWAWVQVFIGGSGARAPAQMVGLSVKKPARHPSVLVVRALAAISSYTLKILRVLTVVGIDECGEKLNNVTKPGRFLGNGLEASPGIGRMEVSLMA